jgi:hypothetical protein
VHVVEFGDMPNMVIFIVLSIPTFPILITLDDPSTISTDRARSEAKRELTASLFSCASGVLAIPRTTAEIEVTQSSTIIITFGNTELLRRPRCQRSRTQF